MIREKTIYSVFPDLNDEIKLKPLVLGTNEVSYDPRVKISNWQNQYLREPRDNTDFFPPKGHLRVASYKNLGTHEPQNYLTETREKIKEHKIGDRQQCFKSTQLLNLLSFPLDDSSSKNRKSKIIEKSPLKNIPEIKGEEVPVSLFRRTLGYSSEDLEKLEGVRTFLDDDLEIYAKISHFKTKLYNR